MMEIVLQGDLGDRFGRNWKVAADSYAEALACIDANYPEFRKALLDLHEAGGDLSIQIGEKLVESNEELFNHLGRDTIVITPIPSGSKSGSAKAIIGTILLITAFIFLPGAIAGIGTAAHGAMAMMNILQVAALAGVGFIGAQLLIAGLQQMWAPDPSVDKEESYSFDGPENTVVSNTPIPILCGEMIIGGVSISSGILVGKVPPATIISTYPEGGGGNGGGGGGGGNNGGGNEGGHDSNDGGGRPGAPRGDPN